MDARFTAELVDYACRPHLFDFSVRVAVAQFASDETAFYSPFETGIRNGDRQRALQKVKALFDLAIVFKHVKRRLPIGNHHAIEVRLVCAQSSSEAETWVLGELAKLPSRE
jgi:hypothetical protein